MLNLNKFQVYIVGGYVRDRWLGLDAKDHDYVVVGATPTDMLAAGFSQVGASFPVFLHPISGDEYALARTERKIGVGYNGFDVVCDPTITIEDDLYRRDLTINAMARLVIRWNDKGQAKLSDHIIDPYGGQRDLAQGIIRHVSEAFAEDPVRVLRAARFAARYNFKITRDTIHLMSAVVPELTSVPTERIWAEIEKGLMEPFSWLMFDALDQCNALNRVPALEDYTGWSKLYGINKEAPLYVRFALVAGAFTPTSYADRRVPTDLTQVSTMFNRYKNILMQYVNLGPAERLGILEAFRAINDSKLLDQCTDCLSYYTEDGAGWELLMNRIIWDLQAVSSVDAAAVASTCKTGLEIKRKLFEARVAAMSV